MTSSMDIGQASPMSKKHVFTQKNHGNYRNLSMVELSHERPVGNHQVRKRKADRVWNKLKFQD